jgi:hypothetical protein
MKKLISKSIQLIEEKINWKESTCHIFFLTIILTFVRKIKDKKTTAVRVYEDLNR